VKLEWASKYCKITHKCINWNIWGWGAGWETQRDR